jgi:hypothetical protein
MISFGKTGKHYFNFATLTFEFPDFRKLGLFSIDLQERRQ